MSQIRDANGAPPRVFVVLLNWNGWQDTLRCVQSLHGLTYPDYAIVIVDNGSVGDDVQILRREVGDSCHIIQNPENQGFSAGNNVGMRYALHEGADYVFVLNNDTTVDAECLTRMVKIGEEDDSIGILAPKVLLHEERERVVYPRFTDQWSSMLQFHIAHTGLAKRWVVPPSEGTCDVRFVDGCAMFIKRQVLQQVGLFEPIHFFGGYESFDFSIRVLSRGWRMVAVLDAAVWAKAGGSSFGDRRRGGLSWAYWGPRDRVLFARRKLSTLHYVVFLLTLPLYLLAWTVAFGRQAKSVRVFPAILRGLRDGFNVELPVSGDEPVELEG